MASIVGVALEASVVRAAYEKNGVTTFVEHAWDSTAPERVIDVLRAEIGNASTLVLAVGLGLLEVAKPDVPAMANADRRRVLLRDADRYFPIEGALAIASGASGALAFGMQSETLQRWVRAFEEWAPVRAVVTGPDAIASVIGESGTFIVDAALNEQGLLHLSDGQVLEARRVPAHAANVPPRGATSLLNVGTATAPGKFSAAVGALTLADAPLDAMLLDTSIEDVLYSMRMRRRWVSYGFAAVALLAVGFSINSRREATLRATRHAVDSLQTLATPGRAAAGRLESLNAEAQILAASGRAAVEPLHVLATISEALPHDAFVQRLEWDGKEWRLDGSVNQASMIVPRLDSARIFSNVHVLGASTRFRDGQRMRETFSVAFQAQGGPVAKR